MNEPERRNDSTPPADSPGFTEPRAETALTPSPSASSSRPKHRSAADERAPQTEFQPTEFQPTEFQTLATVMPVGIFQATAAGACSFVNRKWLELTGLSLADALGQGWIQALHPDDRQAVLNQWNLAIQDGHDFWMEYRLQRPDGWVNWVLGSAVTLRNASGQVTGYLGTVTDITDRKQAELALQHSEERWQFALEGSGDGIWDWNAQTNEVFYSRRWKAMLGYDDPEIGTSIEEWEQRVHPADQAQVFEVLSRHLRGETDQYRSEHRVRCKDGSYKWILDRGKVIHRTADGQPLRVMGTHADISDRKQVEARLQQQIEREHLMADITQYIRQSLDVNDVLRRTVERVRQFLQTDRVLIFRFHPDWQGTVVMESVGADWPSLLGITIADPCFAERYIEPYRQGSVSALADCQAAGASCYRELLKRFQVRATLVVPILQVDTLWGLLIAHHCSAPRPWQPDEIDLLRHLAAQSGLALQQSELYQQVQTELAERRQAERIIQEQAALIDVATDAIFVRDLHNHILFWSKGAERLYGWPSDQVLGQSTEQLFNRESADQLLLARQTTLERGFWTGELEQVTQTGREIIVISRWTLLRNEAGQATSILNVNTDITEKKHLEEQFYRAQRLESLGTLASGIAHDLNNVLTPILAISQLLLLKVNQTPTLDARSQEMLQVLVDSAKRGAHLITQVLTFVRGSEGKRQPLMLDTVLHDMVNILQQTFSKAIVIDYQPPPEHLPTISADATQLHQVLMNLCVNARDAMPNGGTLTLSLETKTVDAAQATRYLDAHEGYYVVVTIADTGIGIPPALMDRIFEPFFTTKEPGQGTGLGLSTVLGIVRNHDGFVHVSSQVGTGTQFQVWFPTVEGTEEQMERSDSYPQGRNQLILIVDDETSVQQATQLLLESYHYRVLLARDGHEAIDLYTQRQAEIGVVMLDMMMPKMDGLTAIQTLKAINPAVKIIASSGLPANRPLALKAGAIGFLAKPYTVDDILQTLHSITLRS